MVAIEIGADIRSGKQGWPVRNEHLMLRLAFRLPMPVSGYDG
jgi:hypothetical protein